MGKPSQLPDPEMVRNFYTRGLRTQVVRIALLLDVFTPMAHGPAEAQTVAQACHCSVTGMALLLDYLCSLGILTKCAGTYQLTPTSAAFLVPTQRSYAGGWVLEQTSPEVFQAVLESLRSGVPCQWAMPWEQLAWLESYDASRIADSRLMWETAGIKPGRHPGLRVLDLACGCSIMSFVLAQADPSVQVTCVDSPQVLAVAEDLARRLSILGQATLIPGDLRLLELPECSYDAVVLGNATNFLTAEQNSDLFHRICRALAPEGSLIVNVTMVTGEPSEHIGLYSLLLWTLTGTEFYSFADYQAWLRQAGFARVDHLSKLWLAARKLPESRQLP